MFKFNSLVSPCNFKFPIYVLVLLTLFLWSVALKAARAARGTGLFLGVSRAISPGMYSLPALTNASTWHAATTTTRTRNWFKIRVLGEGF